jgi:beta-N-acetylhexosaminidase
MTLGPLMIDLEGTGVSAEERELLRHPLVGGVLLFSRNYQEPAQLSELTRAIHAARSPSLIVAVDQEGGRVQRFREGFSPLPAARRIGHEYDRSPRAGIELARHMGWLMAVELRQRGVDISFAPCVDLDYGLSEIIGERAFHADSAAVGQLAFAYMHGMRDAGMAATAKHFPGHGGVVVDSHRGLPVDRRDITDLDPDLGPYRRLIASGLTAVMAAHVIFPAVDPAPASLSPRWIREVLRGELRFQGVVFSDDLSMGAAREIHPDVVVRARQALAGGCDMLPVCNDRAAVLTLLSKLRIEPEPASRLRLVRLHGREIPGRDQIRHLPRWQRAQELLKISAAVPALTLVQEADEDSP